MITTTLYGAMTASETIIDTDFNHVSTGIPVPRFVSLVEAEADNSWSESQQKARKQLSDMQEKIDGALLDPEAWFKKHPIYEDGLETDKEAEKKKILVQAYLQHANQGQPVPMGEDGLDLMRARVAHEKFDGRGADTFDEFHTEIVKEAQGRKEHKELRRAVNEDAIRSATLATVAPDALDNGWQSVRDKVRAMPGYKPEKEADLLEDYHSTAQDTRDTLRPYANEIREMFQTIQKQEGAGPVTSTLWAFIQDVGKGMSVASGGPGPLARDKTFLEDAQAKPQVTRTAFELFQSMKPENRDGFAQALGTIARALPKKEQAEFLANLSKSGGRAVEGAATRAWTAGVDFMTDPDNWDTTSPSKNGGKPTPYRQQADFVNRIKNIAQEVYDPVKDVTTGAVNTWLEKPAYALPGLAINVGEAIYAPPLLFADLTESHYQSMLQRRMDAGDSYEKASGFASQTAAFGASAEFITDFFGAKLLKGQLPYFNKALTRAMDKISNSAARVAVRGVAAAAQEGIPEIGQNYIDAAIQDIAHGLGADVGDVKWLGPDSEFKGDWKENVDTFAQVLPLILCGLPGVLGRDARVKAFRESKDAQLLAAGYHPDDVSSIRDGIAKGLSSGEAAINSALERVDPTSETAKNATHEIAQEAEDQRVAAEVAKASGMVPDIVRSADGFTVLDGETKQEIGTAQDMPGAMRIATAHSAAMDDARAERVAYLATMLEAGDEALAMAGDPNAKNSFELGTVYTEAMAAAEDPTSIDQFAKQAAIQEKINGGDGSTTYAALGRNVAEARGLVRTFTNRLFHGASVTTIVHETTHGMVRRAEEAGIINRDDKLRFVKAVNEVMRGKALTKGRNIGQKLDFLPEGITDADITDDMINEGISHIAEAEILRTRKQTKDAKSLGISAGIISRNLLALSKLVGAKRLGKFRALIDGARGVFGLSSARALAMKKAIREGRLQEADITGFMDKLTGRDHQAEHDGMVYDEHAAIVGQENFTPTDDAPFSLYPSFNLRDDGPTLYVKSNTGVLFPDGHEIKTHTEATDSIPDGGREIWERIRKSETRGSAIQSTWEASADGMADSEWLVQSFANSPGADQPVGTVRGFWLWIRESLNGPQFAGKDPVNTLDAMAHVLQLDPPVSERISAESQLHYLPISDDGTVLALANTGGKADFGRLPTEAEKADAASHQESTGSSPFSLVPNGPVADLLGMTPVVAESSAFAGVTDKAELRKSSDSPLSLAPTRMVDGLQMNAAARIKDPRVKAAMFTRMLGKLGELKRDKDQLGIAFGKGFKRKAIEDPRKAASIRKERNFREATLRQQYEEEAYAKHEGILVNPDLAKLKEQPVHSFLADPDSPLRGQLMSKSAAMARGENFFDPKKQGEFDGVDGVPRSNFGGTLAPDQAAQELFDHGLIKEPTPNAMWDALKREAASVARFKEYHRAATEDVKAGRQQAKAEAKAWEADRLKEEAANYNPLQQMLRALAMFDGILSVLPPDVRGRIGGYTQLAKLNTDEARLKFLNERIERADKEIEKWLGKEYTYMLNKLFERAMPAKGKPGEKPKGKAGASVHSLFDKLREARDWTATDAESHHDKFMAIVNSGMIDDGRGGKRPITPEEDAHMTLEANLVLQIGDWKNADAARKAAAVANATHVFDEGYFKLKFEKLLQKEDRDHRRNNLKKDTGTSADLAARQARQDKDNGTAGDPGKDGSLGKVKRAGAAAAGTARKMAWYAKSFADTVEGLFGRHSAEGQRIIDMERTAAFKTEDSNQADWDAVNDLFKRLAGGNDYHAWQLRHAMTKKTVTAKAPLGGGELRFSQFQAVDIVLTWRRGQGQRHMLGTKDENGFYAGEWHYDQAFVDKVESQLSTDGREWMAWLADQYRDEWPATNPTFEKLQGISLPRDLAYYPISAKPLNDKGSDMLDPVTGLAMTPGSGSPGFLKAINPGAVAEPDFQDSLQKFLTHRRQLNHWLAYAPVMAEVSPIIGNRSLMNHLEARGGKEGADTLRDWVTHFTQGGHRDAAARKWYSQVIQMGLDRMSGAILVGRMTVLAVQTVHLGAAQAEMSVTEYVPRLAKLLFSRSGWSMWKAALDSDFIQRRIQQMPPSLRAHHEQLMKASPTRIRYWQSRLGNTIAGADGLFTAGTYAIIFDQRKAKIKRDFPNLPDAEVESAAHAEAIRLAEKLAQPTRSGTRSLMELQAGTAMRSIWNFSSEPRQKIMLAALRLTSSEYSLTEKARTAFVVWGVGGMMLSVLRAAWRDIKDDGDDDEVFDERNWSITRLALESAMGPFQGLPYVGDMINGMTYAASGQYRSDRGMLSAIPIAVKSSMDVWDSKDLGDVLNHTEKFLTGAAFFNDNLAAAASLSHIARDFFGIIENFDGQTND